MFIALAVGAHLLVSLGSVLSRLHRCLTLADFRFLPLLLRFLHLGLLLFLFLFLFRLAPAFSPNAALHPRVVVVYWKTVEVVTGEENEERVHSVRPTRVDALMGG